MHLTRVLNFYKKFTRVPGLITSGKNQIHKPMTPLKLRNSVKWMLMEDDNKILLNNPYITESEENAFLASRGIADEQKQEKKELLLKEIKARKFRKNMALVDHLEHLNVSKKWE